MQNILIIGNGFDLAHQRKTTYRDFVRFGEAAFAKAKEERNELERAVTQDLSVNGFFRHFHFSLSEEDSWTYFEGEMTNILHALIHVQESVEEKQKDPEYDLITYNIMGVEYTYSDLQIFKHFSRIFEQVYDDPSGGLFKLRQQYITPEKTLDKKALLAEVERELDSFTRALKAYLESEYVDEGAPTSLRLPEILRTDWDYVINFNFTDTMLRYGIPENRVYYVKGSPKAEARDWVLGSPDTMDDHRDWVFLRNDFQQLMSFCQLPDRKAIAPKDEGGAGIPLCLTVFGYSFPEGDWNFLRFLDKNVARMEVYYTDRKDYAQKLMSLYAFYGREELTGRLYEGRLVFTQC